MQPVDTDLNAGSVTNTTDYQPIRDVEPGTRLADDEDSSSPSDSSKFLPRIRPILVQSDSAIGLVEIIKQKLAGCVVSIERGEIRVKLEDLTNPENPDEYVTLAIEEIDPHEQSLIETGATFLWHIGYRQGPKYPRERFSKIRFRRLPEWTESELIEAEKTAAKYASFFHGNTDDSPSA